jgi:hypothetical protein
MALPKFIATASSATNASLSVIDGLASSLTALAPALEAKASAWAKRSIQLTKLNDKLLLEQGKISIAIEHQAFLDEHASYIDNPVFQQLLESLDDE